MSTLLRCNAPGSLVVANHPQGMPAGWLVTSNQTGHAVHAHDGTHLAAAQGTTGNPATVAHNNLSAV